MKTFSLLTFFLTCLLNLSAQDSTTIIITDSSTINIFYYNLIGKFVKETYNDKDLVHHLWYYTDYTTLKSDSYIYKTKRESVGLAKFYDANGKLKVIINNNNQTWIPVDTLRYPYYKLLCVMKEKADSILKEIYCPEFVNDNLTWDIYGSNYFDNSSSEPSFTFSWLNDEPSKYNPTEFYLSYELNINGEKQESAIILIIDLNGNILHSHLWNTNSKVYNRGLEKIEEAFCQNFKFSESDILKLAEIKGLNKEDTSNISIKLTWHKNFTDQENIFNGEWRIYVFELTKTQENENKKHKSITITKKFNLYIFSPWTGKFIEKRKVKDEYEYLSNGMLIYHIPIENLIK